MVWSTNIGTPCSAQLTREQMKDDVTIWSTCR
ncbi:Uncharacterised protein [Moellerella wisconsensis]|nr:Uncharacterised protein [Moellerella wisconsensis]